MDKMSKRLLSFIITLLILGVFPVKAELYIDALGRGVNIERCERVVSLAPSITEILVYLEVVDRLVGVDSSSLNSWFMNTGDYLKSRGVFNVSGYWWSIVSMEKIIALSPDLVLADTGAHKHLLETFESYGLTVYFLHIGDANNIEEVFQDIRSLGLLFSKSSKAEELIETINKAIDTWSIRIRREFGQVKAITIIDLSGGIWIAGKETFIDDLLNKIGVLNVAAVNGWSLVSIEQIISWDPDIIFVTPMYELSEKAIREAGLLDLGKIVVIFNSTEADTVLRPGPLLIYAPEIIYNILVRGLRAGSHGNTTLTTDSFYVNATQETPQVESHPKKPVEMYEHTYHLILVIVIVVITFGMIVLTYRKLKR